MMAVLMAEKSVETTGVAMVVSLVVMMDLA
jgi:hypothetical protein